MAERQSELDRVGGRRQRRHADRVEGWVVPSISYVDSIHWYICMNLSGKLYRTASYLRARWNWSCFRLKEHLTFLVSFRDHIS